MMHRVTAQLSRTFSALSVPNFRLFFYGQSISLVGTWMQSVAQSWLVYSLTHSSTALGAVVAIQTLPVLVLGAYAGVIADRVDKRRLMVVLQSLMGVQALVLGVLAVTHVVTFWQVCVLALMLGFNNTFENPARQSFVLEMVGSENVRNAVSLNSTMVNAARAVGPAVAGIIIAVAGEGVCFFINALSFVAVVYSLVAMDKGTLRPSVPVARAKGQMRAGLRYIAHEPRLAIPLLMMGLVGTLAYEFQVSLPVLAKETFHGGAETYGFLTAFMGAGAVIGGLVTATRGKTGLRALSIAADRLRGGYPRDRGIACPGRGLRCHGPCWLGQRVFPGHRQFDFAAGVGPDNARPCHGFMGRRLPRLDADRWTAHRLGHRSIERTGGAGHRGYFLLVGRRSRVCRSGQAEVKAEHGAGAS